MELGCVPDIGTVQVSPPRQSVAAALLHAGWMQHHQQLLQHADGKPGQGGDQRR